MWVCGITTGSVIYAPQDKAAFTSVHTLYKKLALNNMNNKIGNNNREKMNKGLTSSPVGPISPGGPLRSRYILPSEPWTRCPSLDSMVRQSESSLSVSLVTRSALWSLITGLLLWGNPSPEGPETMIWDSGKASLDISSVASVHTFRPSDVILSVKIPGNSEIPNEGFLASLLMSGLVTLSEGFPGNGKSAFLSVVMSLSTSFDDSSGFPLWLSRCPFLAGFKWRLSFPLLWPVSSSTKTTPR